MTNETEATTPETTPAAKAPANETVGEAMKRIGGADVFEGGEPEKPEAKADEKPAGDAAKDEKAARAKKAEKPEPAEPSGEREQLKSLAEKLGLVLEDGKVTTAERVKLRDEKRTNLAAIARAKDEALAELSKGREELSPRLAKTEALEAAVKGGDYEAIATNLGFKNWNELQEDQLKHFQDPNHKRLRELEERLQKKEAEELTAKEQAAQAQQAEAGRRAQIEYKQGLAADMGKSTDPLVKAMASQPNFVNAIFRVQQAAHQSGEPVPAPEHAIRVATNGSASLQDELKALYDVLHPVFGGKAPPTVTTPEVKPRAKTAPVAPPAPAPRERVAPQNGFDPDQRRRLNAAIEEDKRRERAG